MPYPVEQLYDHWKNQYKNGKSLYNIEFEVRTFFPPGKYPTQYNDIMNRLENFQATGSGRKRKTGVTKKGTTRGKARPIKVRRDAKGHFVKAGKKKVYLQGSIKNRNTINLVNNINVREIKKRGLKKKKPASAYMLPSSNPLQESLADVYNRKRNEIVNNLEKEEKEKLLSGAKWKEIEAKQLALLQSMRPAGPPNITVNNPPINISQPAITNNIGQPSITNNINNLPPPPMLTDQKAQVTPFDSFGEDDGEDEEYDPVQPTNISEIGSRTPSSTTLPPVTPKGRKPLPGLSIPEESTPGKATPGRATPRPTPKAKPAGAPKAEDDDEDDEDDIKNTPIKKYQPDLIPFTSFKTKLPAVDKRKTAIHIFNAQTGNSIRLKANEFEKMVGKDKAINLLEALKNGMSKSDSKNRYGVKTTNAALRDYLNKKHPGFIDTGDDSLYLSYGGVIGRGEQSNVSKDGMLDSEILKLMKPYRAFAGVVMSDQVEKLLDVMFKNNIMVFGFIVNRDTSDKSGSHWMAVYVDLQFNKEICLYDSLGEGLPANIKKDLVKFVERHDLPWLIKFKENKIGRQDYDSNRCGLFAVEFLQSMFTHGDFAKATKFDEKDAEKSEKKYEKFGFV